VYGMEAEPSELAEVYSFWQGRYLVAFFLSTNVYMRHYCSDTIELSHARPVRCWGPSKWLYCEEHGLLQILTWMADAMRSMKPPCRQQNSRRRLW
jgi:hypothetical protein